MNAGGRNALLIAAGMTVLLYALPNTGWIKRPIVWLSTLAHELGHGMAALLVGGSFGKLVLYSDASGMAWTSTRGPVAGALVAAGGLIGPAVAAALCFLAARTPRGSQIALMTGSIGLILVDLVWVRNVFGFVFVLAIALLLGGAVRAFRHTHEGAQVLLAFLGTQLSLAVFSRSDYLFTAVAHTANGQVPSDVAKMAQALWLPHWFWGGVCGAVSVVVLVGGLYLNVAVPAPKRPQA